MSSFFDIISHEKKIFIFTGHKLKGMKVREKKTLKSSLKKLQFNSQKRPEYESGSGIIKKGWVRIRIKSIQIRNLGKKPKLAKLQFAISSQNAVHFVRYHNVPSLHKNRISCFSCHNVLFMCKNFSKRSTYAV
jgi:hypothetical protein